MSSPEFLEHQTMGLREEQERRLRAAALALQDLYESGGEMTEWTSLDGEDFLEGSGESRFEPRRGGL
jgi:hypothetical protein